MSEYEKLGLVVFLIGLVGLLGDSITGNEIYMDAVLAFLGGVIFVACGNAKEK